MPALYVRWQARRLDKINGRGDNLGRYATLSPGRLSVMLYLRRILVGVLVALLAGAFAAQAKMARPTHGDSRSPRLDGSPVVLAGEEKSDPVFNHDRLDGSGESFALDARTFRIDHLADFSFPVCDTPWRLNVEEASRPMAARAPPRAA
jgi:hypothetical protein